MAQLELAGRAGTTPRHLSFVETGRSRPGRELVLRFAEALDVPLRERNALLVAAGFAAEFPERALDDAVMSPVRFVLDRMLRAHEPYPAWVFRRGFVVVDSNRAAEGLFPGLSQMNPEAIVDQWFGPGPFRALVENWHEVVLAGVLALRRDAARCSDATLDALLRRAEGHAAAIAPGPAPMHDGPVACPRFRVGDRTVRTISSVMRFDTAVEITASELRIELMFPADDDSEQFFRART